MRVLYDISVLGEGVYNPQARTGVARVVDNLRLALMAESEVDLSCCAFSSLVNHTKILANLDVFAGLENVGLRHPVRFLPAAAARAVSKIYPGEISSPGIRLKSRFLNGILKGVELFTGGAGPVNMEGVNIFHSTFYPFPEATRGLKPYKRVLLVHDLIPILFPEYCSAAQRHLCHETVGSIGKEDWVLTNSESTKADLCEYAKIDPERVSVTPLAAAKMFRPCNEVERIRAVRKRYALSDVPYVLSVCTFEPRKNIGHVIRSFVELVQAQQLSDLNLVLVGTKGWGLECIEETINNTPELKNKIIVTGYVADEDLPVLYSGAIMFVYPSFYEGFGLPPLEAMQCGVPVITSNTSSLPEVVGDAGIMIDPNDREELCQAMWELYSQPVTRDNYSSKAAERASQFSWQQSARLTVAAYREALAS